MAMVLQVATFLHQYLYESPESPQTPKSSGAVKIGVLSSAMINPAALFHPSESYAGAKVVAIASRDKSMAEKTAKSYKIDKAYGSYEELLNDEEVEAVYISLPNGLHGEWAIKSLQAGKHVLIEKPLCSNSLEAQEIFKVAQETGKIALEAFHWRFHPAAQAVSSMINEEKRFGKVLRTHARMVTPKNTIPASDIRWHYKLAGGALMDETYTVSSTRFFTQPQSFNVDSAIARPWSKDPKVDGSMDAKLKITNKEGDVISSTLHADLDQPNLFWIIPRIWELPSIEIECEKATVYFYNFMMPHIYHYIGITDKVTGKTVYEKHYNSPSDSKPKPWSTYRYQLEAFCDKIKGREPHHWIEPEDSIQQMQVIDAIYEKSGLGKRYPTKDLV